MRIVCVICTELIVVNARISAVHCGHLFHEDCLFKWLDSGQKTCPQCRSTANSKTIVKRLYLTSAETQSFTSLSETSTLTQATSHNENLLNEIEALKDELNQCKSHVKAKNDQIEHRDKKIEELNCILSNNKKTISENKVLLDTLKKETSSYKTFKDQYDEKCKRLQELEMKIKEFKCIGMIYNEHEGAFEAEMKKYKFDVNNAAYTIEQLVRCNVLLKEQADKQIDEKRMVRKKLLQIEKSNQNKDRIIEEKNEQIRHLNETLGIFESNLKSNEEELKKLSKRNTALQNAIESPTCASGNTENLYKGFLKRLIHESPMPQFEMASEKAQMDEPLVESNHLIDSTQTQVILNESNLNESTSPVSKKRKNPFSLEEINKPKQNRFKLIEEFESKVKRNDDVYEVVDQNDTDDDVQIVKPIELNTIKKTNTSIKTLTKHKSNLYSYDGLGGRSKILPVTTKQQKQLTKSKVSSISPFLVKKLKD